MGGGGTNNYKVRFLHTTEHDCGSKLAKRPVCAFTIHLLTVFAGLICNVQVAEYVKPPVIGLITFKFRGVVIQWHVGAKRGGVALSYVAWLLTSDLEGNKTGAKGNGRPKK